MKNFSTWLLVFFMIIFWIFRVLVVYCSQLDENFLGFVSYNYKVEIILLFITVVSFCLIVKRNLIGATIYFVTYSLFFGNYIFSNIDNLTNTEVLNNVGVSAVGIILGICLLGDLLFEKSKLKSPKDKKADWFFDNKQYDRKLDDRADKNQYRNY